MQKTNGKSYGTNPFIKSPIEFINSSFANEKILDPDDEDTKLI